jgi:hypothetical protein
MRTIHSPQRRSINTATVRFADPAPDSPLDVIELLAFPLHLQHRGEDKSLTLKLFTPGKALRDIMQQLLFGQGRGLDIGDLRPALESFVTAGLPYIADPELIRRSTRRFSLSTFSSTGALRELARSACAESLPPREQMLRYATEGDEPTSHLLEQALFSGQRADSAHPSPAVSADEALTRLMDRARSSRAVVVPELRSLLKDQTEETQRSLYFDAEESVLRVFHAVYKQIFRRIRKDLSRAERRAFLVMHMRFPGFNRRIVAHEPMIMTFYAGMDDSTRILIVLWLFFRVRSGRGFRINGEELFRRWRAYLRFRRYWEEMIREEEREARRVENDPGKRVTKDESDRSHGLHDDIDDLITRIFLSRIGKIEDWVEKYCTERQGRCLAERFINDRPEIEIALLEGITQQAVSKAIAAGIGRIREGLERDQGIGPSDLH